MCLNDRDLVIKDLIYTKLPMVLPDINLKDSVDHTGTFG